MALDEFVRVENLFVFSSITKLFILKNISFSIKKGECVALKGPSGVGKTVLAHSIMGLASSGLIVTSGSLTLDALSYDLSDPSQLFPLRGGSIATAFQLPLESFNPLVIVGEQIADSLRAHRPEISAEERKARVLKALQVLGFEDPKTIMNSYPHQLSGGQLQRCILSSVTLFDAKLLIVDEPTASLDPENVELVIHLLHKLNKENEISILLITHDESIITKIAHKTIHLYKGELRPTPTRIDQWVPSFSILSPTPEASTLLQVEGLSKSFKDKRHGLFSNGRKRIFWDISFSLKRGELLGIVGPSGSGKTTLAKCLVGLLQPDKGSIKIDGRELFKNRPLQNSAMLGIYYLWQNPVNCLDPRMTIKGLLSQPLSRSLRKEEVDGQIKRVTKTVGLPLNVLARRPSEISGGQAQRVVIARMLLLDIKVLIADEPMSYLDSANKHLTIQIFLKLIQDMGVSIILISHDQEFISSYCNRRLKLNDGAIYECQ